MNASYELIIDYVKSQDAFHEENLDLSNRIFHREYGLTIHLPRSWSYLEVLLKVIQEVSKKTLIIFPSTAAYRRLYEDLEPARNLLTYISWHEIYTGMQMASSDVRYMQRAKTILSDAELTFFLDPPPFPELIDQVRGHTNGCLVILSQGDGSV